MACKAGRSVFNQSKLRLLPPGEVESFNVLNHVVRRECTTIDSTRFYRFTLNPGMRGEFSTFWTEDSRSVLRVIMDRIKNK
jgi:hypothetical protein